MHSLLVYGDNPLEINLPEIPPSPDENLVLIWYLMLILNTGVLVLNYFVAMWLSLIHI